MSENTQIPQLYTITTGQTLTLTYTRAIVVLSQGGSSVVTNSSAQSMTLADGVTLEMQADNGNTLGVVTITSSATALVSSIGGLGVTT
jgi:hypothetical protein